MKKMTDDLPNRYGTGSVKWDLAEGIFQEEGILPMWVADMDFPSPEPVIKALEERARHGIFGYSACPVEYFNETVSWHRRRQGWSISPGSIIFTPGVVPALNMLVQEFTSGGKKVILQPPVYYPFMGAVKNNGAVIVENRLVEESLRYEMDLVDLEEKASDSETVMMILCSPHNPVGRVWEKEVLAKVAEICRRHEVILVSDEIHGDLVHTGHRHWPTALAGEAGPLDLLVTCCAPSKTFNLPGLQAAYCIIENEELRERFRKRIEANGIHGPNCFGALAQEVAYREGTPWLKEVMTAIKENFIYLQETLAAQEPRIGIVIPEATCLVWLDFRFLHLSGRELREFLRHHARVALNDGFTFGPGGEGFVRINIGCSRETLTEGLERILRALHERENR